MKRKKLLWVLIALLMFAVIGCADQGKNGNNNTGNTNNTDNTDNGGTDSGNKDNNKIGLSVSTLNNPFFVTLTEGAKAAAKDNDIELIVVDAGDDVAKQTSGIEDLISRNVGVIIVNPVDSDAVAPAVEEAIAKGIKVISVDRVVNGVEVSSQIASDNVAGARLAAEYLLELVGEGAKVAELEGVPGASATIDRGKGFHEVADTSLDVVTSQTANFNRAEGLNVMENILQANQDIKGVFAHNDEMALGALEAISSAGKEIVVIGFDATDDAVAAVKDGRMAATVAQKPDLMGKTAVETAVKLLAGETVEASIPVEVQLIKE
ncbi:MAG: D-ribose ABC transporter substrate-binding protein [Clostridiales bacterium]|nr:D-ribose ABC transporter substrate-binding protein [Clostridiales bacterium]